ncbi:TetR/AcrR family transcriptional regulator [Enterococcus rivorum]|uniref:HTH tetR-type domain-containing protein n=1 Tax=Enterococcus rivorum TaxID=762845 RepID=A0A1E5KXV1_9ENTE|nr:TetR/AcrR family transcriptional regulator [Enterococcus rivorum]MBP2099659.1 AcrR family transcriptional regulator [Enterococcus rivorum]OEH82686.1 hypothetical protein BCR26_12175 [Enterococcus rivorum]
MVRKKVYKREHILKSAFEVLQKNGFSGLTARNVADHMGISTQPIYLEFENMEDLKMTLLNSIYDDLASGVFACKTTSDAALNFGFNFIDFAKKNTNIFIALYTEQHGYGDEIKAHTFKHFLKHIKNDEQYTALSEKDCEKIHNSLLVVASGIASMSLSGIIAPSQKQISELLEKTIQAVGWRNN